eukprot:2050570-Pyramimonas_sp.AAC.1
MRTVEEEEGEEEERRRTRGPPLQNEDPTPQDGLEKTLAIPWGRKKHRERERERESQASSAQSQGREERCIHGAYLL